MVQEYITCFCLKFFNSFKFQKKCSPFLKNNFNFVVVAFCWVLVGSGSELAKAWNSIQSRTILIQIRNTDLKIGVGDLIKKKNSSQLSPDRL